MGDVNKTGRSEPEEDLFFEALSRTDPAARRAFLDEGCAGDAALRARVEELLVIHAEAERFFARAATGWISRPLAGETRHQLAVTVPRK
jgi:hypothetical protein